MLYTVLALVLLQNKVVLSCTYNIILCIQYYITNLHIVFYYLLHVYTICMLTVAVNGHLVFYSAFVKTFFQSLVFLFCIPVCIYYAFANIYTFHCLYMHSYVAIVQTCTIMYQGVYTGIHGCMCGYVFH